ncbi:hypothetical protein ROZALSC1DRAFT_26756 [Rozella allomycis CSF55]|uniref:Endonuclease/exonuclease/phosphatase domain-containing protein n=1 Tax=Rozella allomycis (strain CSF55) TaxID=988480 RepID=A0A4P9YPY0_ROZAC|nr:hypothetical protein ROZALSC1DRAFT_26756 [Rozella allomycis CSF55]
MPTSIDFILNAFGGITTTNNIAIIVVLQDVETMDSILVSTGHLYWRPLADFIRLKQYSISPCIVCGDFNMTPDSALYKCLTSAKLSLDDLQSLIISPETLSSLPKGIENSNDAMEHTRFNTMENILTYFTALRSEPGYTVYTPSFKQTIDYIFYDPQFLQVLSVQNIPHIEHIEGGEIGLPNSMFGSDHLSIASEFVVLYYYKSLQ